MGKKHAKTQRECKVMGLCMHKQGMVPLHSKRNKAPDRHPQGASDLPVMATAGPGSREHGDCRPWHCPLLLLACRGQQLTSAGAVGASQPRVCCSSWSANTWAAQQSSHTPQQPLHESTGILLLQTQPGLVSLLHCHRPLQTGRVFSKNHPDLGPR